MPPDGPVPAELAGASAVHLSYASPLGHTLLDVALYLPKSWTEDPQRRVDDRHGPDPAPDQLPGDLLDGDAGLGGGHRVGHDLFDEA